MSIDPLFLSLLFFTGLTTLSSLYTLLKRVKRKESKKQLKLIGSLFFYRKISDRLYSKSEEERALLFATATVLNLTRFFTVFFLALSFDSTGINTLPLSTQALLLLLLVVSLYWFGEYLPKYWALKYPGPMLFFSAPIASLFLLSGLPFTFFLYRLSSWLGAKPYFGMQKEPLGELKQELLEILQDSIETAPQGSHDKKLIESVLRFRTKIAREVMVPRVDVFALSEKTTIKDAAKALEAEGYSRIPVYKETIDQISGILMYRDILSRYISALSSESSEKALLAPIESILRPALYTPETKPISTLLQEFKKKQTHLAIVVDEYGGTAGIVTIEDLLEEIVGEIEDEYDLQDEDLFTPVTEGVWIADGRLSLIDCYEQLGVELPQEAEYDSLGGFIFHRAGAIPSKGFKIQLDTVELEVMKSNERRVEKVKIKKRQQIHD